MSQAYLSKWLKAIIILVGLFGAVFYLFFVLYGLDFIGAGSQPARIIWTVFVLTAMIPCYAVLGHAWSIARNIGNSNSFCEANARHLRRVSFLAVFDPLWFFAGSLTLFILKMSSGAAVVLSISVIIVGVALSVVTSVLSYLVGKAADLQEQSDLTI